MLSSLKKNISKHLVNLPGWRTNRKIVVFESDDWGSIRMPSREVYEKCLRMGYQVDKNIFSRYDSLASEEDLEKLYDLLLSIRNINGQNPVITANCLVANPDFEKINESNFDQYHFEIITETFKKYPKHKNCFNLWMKGLELGIFKPQSHGREHLNVSRFMEDLRSGQPDALFAFDHHMPGIFWKDRVEEGNEYIVALEYKDLADKISKGEIVRESLDLFEKFFGFRSTSFIATNYIWAPEHEKILFEGGVKCIQGSRYQNIPKGNYSGFKRKFHYLGQKSKWGPIFLTRNVTFEPSLNHKFDWVSSALKEIDLAFFWGKPAIISIHRINFVGYLVPENRDRNFILFNELLKNILLKWPDVEFMTSDQLGAFIQAS